MRTRCILLLATVLALAVESPLAQSGANRTEPWDPATVELFESLPIQDGGRIKPLHTFAGFTLLRMQGKRSIKTASGERLTPVEWLLDTLFFPEAAADYPTFLVQNDEVIGAIGLSLEGKRKRDRYSFNELRPGIGRLFQLANQYSSIEEKDRSTVQQQLFFLAMNVSSYSTLQSSLDFARADIPLADNADLARIFPGRETVSFDEVVANMTELRAAYLGLAGHADVETAELRAVGSVLQDASELAGGTEMLPLIPPPAGSDDSVAWIAPADAFQHAFEGGGMHAEQVAALASLRRLAETRGDPLAFHTELTEMHGRIVAAAQALGQYEKIPLELTYYKSKILDYSQYLFVLSFLLMAFMWLKPKSRVLFAGTSVVVLGATACLTGAITLRCLIRDRPPVSTLYETVLFVTACGVIVAMFMEAVNRQKIALSAAAILGTVGLFIANGYEMLDKRDTMPSLVAVLDTNFWLATHVTAITIGYSAGMLAALLASVYLLAKLLGPGRRPGRDFFRSLGRMVYGVLCFAVIFSLVGTILGGVWANDSWGRFWGWDPKENGALLIVLSQLVILHGRMGGYLKEHGVCMAVAFGGTVIGFSWWGVNLLGVGLHSYGFTSGIYTALWTYYGIQWGIVGLGGLAWLLEKNRMAALAKVPSQPQRRAVEGEMEGTPA